MDVFDHRKMVAGGAQVLPQRQDRDAVLQQIVHGAEKLFFRFPQAQHEGGLGFRVRLAGGQGDPAQPDAAKRAARASRANALFSIPMLWFMVFTTHFSNAYADPNGGVIFGVWGIFILIVGFIELSALGLLGGLDNGFNRNVFDKHRNTIIAGFVVWALLFFGGWEIVIGS